MPPVRPILLPRVRHGTRRPDSLRRLPEKGTLVAAPERRALAPTTHAAALGLGLLTAWPAFYWLGRILLSIPNHFHDGTLWDTGFWQE